jgi:excisionase family DNA binding protein
MAAEQHHAEAPRLYTAQEAAAILRVKQSWLERQAADRKIPFTMLGGSYRFTSAHLEQIIRLHERAPVPGGHNPGSRHASRRRDGLPEEAGRTTAPLRPRPRRGPQRAA